MMGADWANRRRLPRRKVTQAAGATDDLLVIATLIALGAGPLFGAIWRFDISDGPWPIVAGLLIGVLGLRTRYLATATLANQYTLTPFVDGDWKVIDWGPYAIVRHPGYTGLLLQISALVLITGQMIGLLSIPWLLACILIRIAVEEDLLLSAMPTTYFAYRESIKWRLIPLVL